MEKLYFIVILLFDRVTLGNRMYPVLLELFFSKDSSEVGKVREIAVKALKKLDVAVLVERDISEYSNTELAARYGIKYFPSLLLNHAYKIGIPRSERELLWIFRRYGLKV
jgi:hypothetical protein